MKALFIAYNQSFGQDVINLLDKEGQRGFSQWVNIQGRGAIDGEPHYGNHAWPVENYAILTIVQDDEKARKLLKELNKMDEASPDLGLRAFLWNVEDSTLPKE
jgi:hypothetical protein